ncbi:SHOCT domain-containing protein, partial [Streptomyces beijiangensis]
ALVGAAVAARLDRGVPEPADRALTPAPAPAPALPAADDHDALLRRLRELGELHQSGILDADEFKEAKQAILKRLQ